MESGGCDRSNPHNPYAIQGEGVVLTDTRRRDMHT